MAEQLGSSSAASTPQPLHLCQSQQPAASPYNSLQAARQMFGGAAECYSPMLAITGWDGSAAMAFAAWQHVTLMLWQRRLQTAAPLIRRRRHRCASHACA